MNVRALYRLVNNSKIASFQTVMKRNCSSNSDGLLIANPKPFVFHVQLNRPNKLNALNRAMWIGLKQCFEDLSTNPECRAIVLSGEGSIFTAGIDLNDMLKLGQDLSEISDVARKGAVMDKLIKLYQDSISSLEVCPKPVIAAVHSACVGAGVDLTCAADIRYCTENAWFQIKEVDIGMAADVGTLQRLPKIIGNQSLVRDLCFTARKFSGPQAKEYGFVSEVFKGKEEMLSKAIELAEMIAAKSPVAVQATKKSIVYSLDHTNQEGLNHIREMNKLLLQSEDFLEATASQLTKSGPPVFSKL